MRWALVRLGVLLSFAAIIGCRFGQGGIAGGAWAAQNTEADAASEEITRGDALLGDDKIDQAIQAYRQAVQQLPSSAQAHQRLARALSLAGDLDGAQRENRQAIALDAGNALAHGNLGWVLGLQKHFREAAAEERTAIQLDPSNATAHLTLGLALTSLGDYDGAIQANQKVIELDPDNLRAYVNLGATLGRKGDYPAAIRVYQRALELNPRSVSARLGLGAALGKSGDIQGQVKQYRQAVALAPESDSAHGKLGWALNSAGDWQGALREGFITNWLRLRKSGPEFLQSFVSLWGGVFLLFGLLFAVLFFGSRFKPLPDEVVIKSYFLTMYKDKPGRFVLTNKRVVFAPESISRWFGSCEIGIERDQIDRVESTATRTGGKLVLTALDGTSYQFSMPTLVLKPLLEELSRTSVRVMQRFRPTGSISLATVPEALLSEPVPAPDQADQAPVSDGLPEQSEKQVSRLPEQPEVEAVESAQLAGLESHRQEPPQPEKRGQPTRKGAAFKAKKKAKPGGAVEQKGTALPGGAVEPQEAAIPGAAAEETMPGGADKQDLEPIAGGAAVVQEVDVETKLDVKRGRAAAQKPQREEKHPPPPGASNRQQSGDDA